MLFVDVASPLRFPKAMFVLHYFFVDVDSWMMYRLRLRKKWSSLSECGDSTFFQQMASEMQERNPIVIIASCSRMFNLDEYNFNRLLSICGKTGFGPVLDG